MDEERMNEIRHPSHGIERTHRNTSDFCARVRYVFAFQWPAAPAADLRSRANFPLSCGSLPFLSSENVSSLINLSGQPASTRSSGRTDAALLAPACHASCSFTGFLRASNARTETGQIFVHGFAAEYNETFHTTRCTLV